MDNLPEELVIQILLQAIWPLDQASGRSWLAQVSPAWKLAIDNCFLFWTDAVVRGTRDVLGAVLSHNPGGPLDVWIMTGGTQVVDSWDPRNLAMVSKHSNRWRSLSFRGLLTEKVIVHFEKPTSKLENVFISTYTLPPGEQPRRIVFAPGGRNLHKLHLACVSIDWNSRRLWGLKALRLYGLKGGQAPSLVQLAAILVASPQLQVLALTTVKGSDTDLASGLEGGAIQLLSLTTITISNNSRNILDFIMSSIDAPNCDSFMALGLSVSEVRPTQIVRHLQSFLRRSQSHGQTFTLRSDEIGGRILLKDRDRYLPNYYLPESPQEEKPGISVGFESARGPLTVENHQRFASCYSSFCDVLADAMVPQDAFGVTLQLNGQGRPHLGGNGVVSSSSDPYSFPLNLLNRMSFIKSIVTKRWYQWAPTLNYLSKPQTNPVTGEESWPCPRLESVELEKDSPSNEPREMEEMNKVLDRFIKARSFTTALQTIKIVDTAEECTRVWQLGQWWSVAE